MMKMIRRELHIWCGMLDKFSIIGILASIFHLCKVVVERILIRRNVDCFCYSIEITVVYPPQYTEVYRAYTTNNV